MQMHVSGWNSPEKTGGMLYWPVNTAMRFMLVARRS
jgi:hypothetical protein